MPPSHEPVDREGSPFKAPRGRGPENIAKARRQAHSRRQPPLAAPPVSNCRQRTNEVHPPGHIHDHLQSAYAFYACRRCMHAGDGWGVDADRCHQQVCSPCQVRRRRTAPAAEGCAMRRPLCGRRHGALLLALLTSACTVPQTVRCCIAGVPAEGFRESGLTSQDRCEGSNLLNRHHVLVV